MSTKRYPFPTMVEIIRRPRRRRRKETIFAIGGFLLTLAGAFWLLEDEPARVTFFRMLPNDLAVVAGVPTHVPDEATASQPKPHGPAADSQVIPAQLATKAVESSRRSPTAGSAVASNRRSGEDATTLWSERTSAFWNSLNRIMTKEVAMRKGHSQRDLRSAEFAVRAIRGLDRRYVDVRVQALAEEIVDWYSDQLRTAPGRTVVLTAATQGGAPQRHVRRDVDLDRRSEMLRGKMSDKYNRPFPSLQ